MMDQADLEDRCRTGQTARKLLSRVRHSVAFLPPADQTSFHKRGWPGHEELIATRRAGPAPGQPPFFGDLWSTRNSHQADPAPSITPSLPRFPASSRRGHQLRTGFFVATGQLRQTEIAATRQRRHSAFYLALSCTSDRPSRHYRRLVLNSGRSPPCALAAWPVTDASPADHRLKGGTDIRCA